MYLQVSEHQLGFTCGPKKDDSHPSLGNAESLPARRRIVTAVASSLCLFQSSEPAKLLWLRVFLGVVALPIFQGSWPFAQRRCTSKSPRPISRRPRQRQPQPDSTIQVVYWRVLCAFPFLQGYSTGTQPSSLFLCKVHNIQRTPTVTHRFDLFTNLDGQN